jgi:hypothetical protein
LENTGAGGVGAGNAGCSGNGGIGCYNNGNVGCGCSENVRVKCKYYTANVDVENLRSYYALKKFGFIDSGIKNGPYGMQYKLFLVK